MGALYVVVYFSQPSSINTLPRGEEREPRGGRSLSGEGSFRDILAPGSSFLKDSSVPGLAEAEGLAEEEVEGLVEEVEGFVEEEAEGLVEEVECLVEEKAEGLVTDEAEGLDRTRAGSRWRESWGVDSEPSSELISTLEQFLNSLSASNKLIISKSWFIEIH